MGTFSQNDITILTVGDSSVATTTGDISGLNQGEIGIFTPSGVRLTESSAAAAPDQDFVIVQGRGTATPIVSKKLSGANVKSSRAVITTPATEQIDYIGYNTVSGAIDAVNDELYIARLHMDQSITSNQGQIQVKHGQYLSGPLATEVEIADGLIVSFINNFSRDAEKQAIFERVTSSTVTANTTGALTVINGSKFVTAATDIDNGGSVAGDYMEIGGIAYKVVAYNVGGAQVAELDVPYQGASNAALAGTGFITAANSITGNWGVKLTGVPLKYSLGKISYRKAKWVTALQSFGTTPVTNSQASYVGLGTVELAEEMEFFYRANDGNDLRMGEPNIFHAIKDVTNQTYDSIHIEVEETGGFTTRNKRSINYLLLIPNSTPSYADTATADDITDILEILTGGTGAVTGALTI